MSALSGFFLTPFAQAQLRQAYEHAHKARRMRPGATRLYIVGWVLAHLFLRLEGAAWTQLRARYRPWFSHLANRPYRFADPLRYLLQALWVLLAAPDGKQQSGVWAAVKAALRRAWVYVLSGRRWFFGRLVKCSAYLKQQGLPHRVSRNLFQTGPRANKLLFFVLTGLAGVLGVLLITQPFSNLAQLIFVLLLWALAMVVRRVPGRFSTLMLIVLSLTVSFRYMWWRYTSSLNLGSPMDTVFGMTLLAAETYSWLVLIMGYVQTAMPLRRMPAPLPADTGQWPTVDLMIPTYNEDLSVVEPTVYAALGMDWPKDKLRIHLLDDGRRDEFRRFAEKVGINYIVRPDGRHAKAGNLNHALGKTDGELVAIFDCDHIPTRSFLQVTVGWFLADPKMALVQTPHHFLSPDPFERNLGNFGQRPNENTLFYGLVQDGNDLWNAAFFCGSCAVLRRSALEEIGGFAVETVTEDAHTALRLHRNGFSSAYLRIPQAAGLATESLSAHIGQRIRWARGMTQIFRTDNPLLGKGLSLVQRLCYLNAMMHFLSGIPRIIYLTAPLAFLIAHSYIVYAPAIAILLNVVPHMVHAGLTNSRMQGSYRHTFWGEVYETVLAWYIARPTTVALFSPAKGSFNVTAKGGLIEQQYFDWGISHPYVLLALANFVGLGFGFWRLFAGPSDEIITVFITMAWVIYNLVILGAAIAVAAEFKQIRRSHRVPASLPANLQLEDGYLFPATLTDYSDGGMGLVVHADRTPSLGDRVSLQLYRGDRSFSFPAQVKRNLGKHIGVELTNLTMQQSIDLVQCTFARADSWLAWQERLQRDRPLRSLHEVIQMGFSGYGRLIRHLPFPFNVIGAGCSSLIAWLYSFIPRMRPAPHPFEHLA